MLLFVCEEEGGLNVEALAFVPRDATPFGQDALLLGLRGPLEGTENVPWPVGCNPAGQNPGRGRAFYFYLVNPDAYLPLPPDGSRPAPDLRGPFTVNLNNRGFRDATLITIPELGPRLLIIAGSVGGPERPAAYLFNTRTPFSVPLEITPPPGVGERVFRAAEVLPTPMRIALPPNSATRAIEAAAVLTVGGIEPAPHGDCSNLDGAPRVRLCGRAGWAAEHLAAYVRAGGIA